MVPETVFFFFLRLSVLAEAKMSTLAIATRVRFLARRFWLPAV